MRQNGITDFPDPDSSGHLILPNTANVDPQLFQSVSVKCESLLPANLQPSNVTSPQNLAGLAKFAQCMTAHGYPVSADGSGSLSFPNSVDPQSSGFHNAAEACKGLVPDGVPGT